MMSSLLLALCLQIDSNYGGKCGDTGQNGGDDLELCHSCFLSKAIATRQPMCRHANCRIIGSGLLFK